MDKVIKSLLSVLENGQAEHISLLKEVNKRNEEKNEDTWDYQTAAESKEALIKLRRLLTKEG